MFELIARKQRKSYVIDGEVRMDDPLHDSVLLMIHGFGHRMGRERDLAETRVLYKNWHGRLWDLPNTTLGSLLWDSKPSSLNILRGANSYKIAYDWAWECGMWLGRFLSSYARPGGKTQLNILAHSLGSRVVLSTLSWLYFQNIESMKVVLIGGAEYSENYARLRNALPHVQFFNISSRHDKILDLFGENFGPNKGGGVIGNNGLAGSRFDNWIDIQLDSPPVKAWIEKHYGLHVSGDDSGSAWDHAIYYSHPDNMALYKLLFADASITPQSLRESGLPEMTDGRWGD